MILFEKCLTVQGHSSCASVTQLNEKHFFFLLVNHSHCRTFILIVFSFGLLLSIVWHTAQMIKQDDRLCQIKRVYINDVTEKASGLDRSDVSLHCVSTQKKRP